MDIKPNPLPQQPQQPQVNRPMMNFPNQQAGHPHPAMMGMQMRGGSMINPLTDISEQEEKKREFARSVYVSGFEKTVTSAMVEKQASPTSMVTNRAWARTVGENAHRKSASRPAAAPNRSRAQQPT